MAERIGQEIDIIDKFTQKKNVSGSLRILIPLYITYTVFVLSVFLIFIPQQKKQLLAQKKDTILQLTDSTLSLLTEFDLRVRQGKITSDQAREQAIHQIRNLRYGSDSKDYFWIIDYHPFMVMHPYRPDLEGFDLTLFKDNAGNHPFAAMVEMVMQSKGGYVNYSWQRKDTSPKVSPKISYIKGFSPWGWIIGTGIYMEDIQQEIKRIRQKFLKLFGGILIFVILLSLYITQQVVRTEQKKNAAEQARDLEELRLKKLLELSQMTEQPAKVLTTFAVEEAIRLTQSDIGYLAFLNEEESQLTMHTWSKEAMAQCEIEDKPLIFNLEETGLWAQAVRDREPMIINDYANFSSPQKKGYPAGHVMIRRVLNVPIFDGERIVALAGVGNKKEAYDESDVRQLQLMMDGMWKIIQKKKAQDDLRTSESRYRLLADNATDAIWILELPGSRFSYVSPAMETILGYSPREFIDLQTGTHMSKKSLKKVSQTISEELARDSDPGADANRYRTIELEMITKKGAKIWVEITARFLRNEKGVPDRILGITRDITQRKALAQKLEEANIDLRMAQRIAAIGNWSLAPEAAVPVWSEEVYHIYERDPELGPFPIGDYQKLYRPKCWEILNTAIQNAIQKGRAYDIELKLVLPSGKVKWVHTICEPEKSKDKAAYFLRGTIQDITDRKTMETRIQQTLKMEALGTLAGGIAHDFNNILSSVLGFAELAKLRTREDQGTQDNLDQVLAAGLRARELVRHILTFSRRADVQKQVLQVVPLIKEVLAFLRASISSNIEIKTGFNPAEASVLADPTQIHQVLMNLFTNAAHAMKETGGTLEVLLESVDLFKGDLFQSKELGPGKYVRLTISDTGSGIPKHLTDKIFEPFFTTKPKGEGTGMGLALAYGIIKEMKGHISVYSEPEMGTTFQILLPEQTSADALDRVQQAAIMEKGKGKLLLADDEPGILEWMSQLLLKLGYEIVSAANGHEALEKFTRSPADFDLVLTDLTMPKMTGLSLSKKITALMPDMPIVLCTGFSEGLTAETMKECGISEILMKPIIASELARAIKMHLKQPVKQD
ncbi:MAG: cache domain-containing protein [Proteobacteria bacterium]|nr:cache domain-containing protein [Pseudomonadota bacterium]